MLRWMRCTALESAPLTAVSKRFQGGGGGGGGTRSSFPYANKPGSSTGHSSGTVKGKAAQQKKLSVETDYRKTTSIPQARVAVADNVPFFSNSGGAKGMKGNGPMAKSTSKVGRMLSSRYVAFVWENSTGIMMYQFFLEGLVTFFFFNLMGRGYASAEQLQYGIDKVGFGWLIDLRGHVWEEDIAVPGRRPISKEFATRFSQGHAFAMAVLPLQLPFILASYPFVHRVGARMMFHLRGGYSSEAAAVAAAKKSASGAKEKMKEKASKPF